MDFGDLARNMQSADKQYPLHLAARDGDLTMAKALMKADPALVRQKDYMGETPLHKAAQFGRGRAAEMAELLLAGGKADVNARDNGGKTPLLRAVIADNMGVVKVLCDHGADVNAKDGNGFTPLHEAACGNKEVVEVLLAYGADPNAKDEIGVTPLDNARSYEEIAQLLRQHGDRKTIKARFSRLFRR